MPAEQRLRTFGKAFVRYLQHLYAGLQCELLHQEMRRGAGAGRGVRELTGIGARIVEKLAQALQRRIGTHGDAEGVAGDADDVGEVVERIPVDGALVREAKRGDREL